MAVELRNRLNRACADAYTAPNTLVFDYPDIATLARHLAPVLGDAAASGSDAAERRRDRWRRAACPGRGSRPGTDAGRTAGRAA